ncbi:hypothetical protein OH735_00830 [Streptomyces sp. NBC_01618]|nr:hypothetical protein OH735_00830 [Streptomyces sp. NBC_01618]
MLMLRHVLRNPLIVRSSNSSSCAYQVAPYAAASCSAIALRRMISARAMTSAKAAETRTFHRYSSIAAADDVVGAR